MNYDAFAPWSLIADDTSKAHVNKQQKKAQTLPHDAVLQQSSAPSVSPVNASSSAIGNTQDFNAYILKPIAMQHGKAQKHLATSKAKAQTLPHGIDLSSPSSNLFKTLQKREKTFKSLREKQHNLHPGMHNMSFNMQNMQALQTAQQTLTKMQDADASQTLSSQGPILPQGNATISQSTLNNAPLMQPSQNIQHAVPPSTPVRTYGLQNNTKLQTIAEASPMTSASSHPTQEAKISTVFANALPSNLPAAMMSALNKYERMGKTF